MPVLERGGVREILERDERLLRSYSITQAYADLSVMIDGLLFPNHQPQVGPRDANFWTYLTWSAYSLTGNIRAEGPTLDHPDGRVSSRARRFLTPLAMRSLAQGQVAAFEDCARIGIAFCEGVNRKNPRDDVVNACVDDLPHQFRSVRDIQDIRAGISALYDAAELGAAIGEDIDKQQNADYSERTKRRSELILLASIHLDAAEQKLVQRALEDAFYAIPDRLLGLKDGRGLAGRGRLSRRTARKMAPLLYDVAARLITDFVFAVTLPDETIKLGRDLPTLENGRRYPPNLTRLENRELERLFRRFDNTYANGTGSAAHDWTDYWDRMSFIVNYLRSRQQSICPLQQPYRPYQAARIRAGKLPWLEPGEVGHLLRGLKESMTDPMEPDLGQGWGTRW